MRRHIFTQIDYNLWANQRTVHLLSSMDPAVLDRPISNSFPTIKETLKHIHYAESIWLQRIKLDKSEKIPWPESKPSADQLYELLLRTSEDLKVFTDQADQDLLNKTVAFITGEGASLTNTIERILYHVVNHSTYHRGQVITILKQLGIEQAVSTDLYFYYQEI